MINRSVTAASKTLARKPVFRTRCSDGFDWAFDRTSKKWSVKAVTSSGIQLVVHVSFSHQGNDMSVLRDAVRELVKLNSYTSLGIVTVDGRDFSTDVSVHMFDWQDKPHVIIGLFEKSLPF